MKRTNSILLCAVLALSIFSGCGSTAQKQPVETWLFTDSCGREVELPVEVDEIVPSGSLAQMILYTVCPQKLQSLSTALTRIQKRYIDKKYWDLPVTGQFYGGKGTINYEEILAAAPDIIIDMGESKETIANDMDELQAKTGIPVVFIEASFATMAEAYNTLGRITGEAKQAGNCAEYIRKTLSELAELSVKIPESGRKRVLYAQGEYGTEVLGVGSVHAQVLDYVAAVNVAQLSSVASEGGNEVSMEQIFLWGPEVVILSPDANYDEIFDDPTWANVSAVQNGMVYEIPEAPYNWIDRPPSVQRVLGMRWLSNLLYPDVFNYDMLTETRKFYSLFWHYEMSEDEARGLMENSTFKEG